jgi:FAD/FMN-containing dehydrogenase
MALPRLNQASQAATMMGGKRYLSDWVQFDDGELWPSVVALKRKYDPKGILNPHFLKPAE